MSLEELEGIPEVGPIVAASVHEYFKDPETEALLEELKAAGISPTVLEP